MIERALTIIRHSLLSAALLGPLVPGVAGAGAPPSPSIRGEEDSAPLVDIGGELDRERLVTQDATVDLVGDAGRRVLRVSTGVRAPWPGVTIKAPGEAWDLSGRGFLSMRVGNTGAQRVRVHLRVDNAGADGVDHCVTRSIELAPGARGEIDVLLQPRVFSGDEIEFVGMRGNPPVQSKLDPSKVTQLVVFLNRPAEEHVFEITAVRVGGRPRSAPRVSAGGFFPMIDELGQYIHAEWPGKTHSGEELIAHGRAEEEDLDAHPGPPGRNRYGGWTAGPLLEATGFFRTERHHGKWWLVDPEGRLFWSHGVDCVHPGASTPISDREHYYRALPEASSPAAQFYGRGTWAPHGYYKDRTPYRTYDFFAANLLRKYGEDWEDAFAKSTHRRLRSWGLNTIANWSDRKIYGMRGTPYVVTINSGGASLEGSEGYWGKFRDVFDPAFERSLRDRLSGETGRSAGDPWCIGYFVDNELGWGDDVSLAEAALVSPPEQAAKQAFLADLRTKYGVIESLNAAWGTDHASWDDLAACRKAPDRQKARGDLEAFSTRTAETYFRTIRGAVKEVAPHQLYLGCRFAWVNERAARAAAKFCDVVSYNRYTYDVEEHRLPEGIDKPTIIGEFHFGALDRGLFHTGLKEARDQEHRARLYTDYVEGALRNPQIVGTHWFQYKDQATTGRGDGENYQIGFVDVCDRPYPEIRRAAREVGARMYAYRLQTPAAMPVAEETVPAAGALEGGDLVALGERFGEYRDDLPAVARLGVEELLAYEEGAHFVYLRGRGALGDRRIVFCRPDTFVIYDVPAGEPRWQLLGRSVPQVAGRRFSVTEGEAVLSGEAMLPGAELRTARADGKSIVEAVPADPAAIARFLLVLRVGGSDAAPKAACVEKDGVARLVLASGERTFTLALPAAPATAGTIAVTRGSEVLLAERLLASGVLPHGPDGVKLLEGWDQAYRRGSRPGWDVGHPAPELRNAVETGAIRPARAIVLGCGAGTNAIYLASQGFDVTGIDLAPTALEQAKERARLAGVRVRWLLADVLAVPELGTFDFIFDRGCYHGVRRYNAAGYVATIRRVSRAGTRFLLLAGNANESRHYGPPRVEETDLVGDLAADWDFVWLKETRFDASDPAATDGPWAWSVLVRRKAAAE